MQRSLVAGLAAGIAMLSGCSAVPADPVFVGARVEPIECPDGYSRCVRVFDEVDGNRAGAGSCVLYATTKHGRVAMAASDELELVPGTIVEWVVRVPSHLGDWNPVFSPRRRVEVDAASTHRTASATVVRTVRPDYVHP